MKGREQLWNGNTESWRGAFGGRNSLFVYAIRKHVSQRRTMRELLGRPELVHLRLVRLRSSQEVDRWLAQVAANAERLLDSRSGAGEAVSYPGRPTVTHGRDEPNSPVTDAT
jgi:hypothetical protein